jgi:beta-glucosidase-like glycosyl hydrolase/CubicO group peptidase (beta-lactamase class C family)
MKRISGLIVLVIIIGGLNLNMTKEVYNSVQRVSNITPPFLNADTIWVDSIFNTLTEDERIAQLLMYPAYSNKDKTHEDHIKSLIKDYKIGGLIFMQGGPYRQVKLINEYQKLSKVPLLISMDAEWSLSMRLDSTVVYPRQMMLGAIQNNDLIYKMGAEFARQLKRTGVHISFSPDIDVNNNPLNPVINDRSFGENKYNVAIKGYHYMKGLQDNGIMACAKHFPGHGDTNVDSHHSLPQINHDIERLDSIEFYPFKFLIKNGIDMVMVSHLFVPAIDSSHNIPATLSPVAINEMLKKDMEFSGLVITDAMNMGGIVNYFKAGKADLQAILAGNDIILFPNDAKLVINEIKKAIADGFITQEEIDSRCKKILKAKYWVGLDDFSPIDEENLYYDLNSTEAKLLQQELIENAITLVKNQNSIIPIKGLDTVKIATISFGINKTSDFQNRLKYYANVDNFIYNSAINIHQKEGLLKKLEVYDIVIVSIHNTNRLAAKKFGISDNTVQFVDELATRTKVILDIFANPYSLGFFKNADKIAAIIVSYNDWSITNDLSAQLIFGGISALGRLPVSASEIFPEGTGVDIQKTRLKYSNIPETAHVDSKLLYKVDSIINAGLNAGAYPGGQIVAARNEIVFYQKSFGNHTDKNSKPVDDFDIYDLASVTKVIATNTALMKLYDENQYELNDKLSEHLKFLKSSNKENMTIKDILTHRAGFKSWIAFYKETIKDNKTRNKYYKTKPDSIYSIPVADKMFIDKNFIDKIYDSIKKSDLNKYGTYVYSDLGFYFMKQFIEQKTEKPVQKYVNELFFAPIGAWTTGYLPLNDFNKSQIVPTEKDTSFRKQLLHGYVHDQGAAMLGGIAGHAGLFSNANDLAKIMQMFLNKGTYGGDKYIDSTTIETFTKYQFLPTNNRRGLGWDKKHPTDHNIGVGAKSASDLGYGHGGYTGTLVWADPKYDFLLIFNSNRVYPTSNNPKITKMNIRTDIEEIFYQAIKNFDQNKINNIN